MRSGDMGNCLVSLRQQGHQNNTAGSRLQIDPSPQQPKAPGSIARRTPLINEDCHCARCQYRRVLTAHATRAWNTYPSRDVLPADQDQILAQRPN